MSFQKEKKDVLVKQDKSKKKKVDIGIKKLVDLINSKENYYTSSSCSGRIVLIKMNSERKDKAEWAYITHNKADFGQIKKALRKKSNIWFKQEPLIIHVCCDTVESAKKFILQSRKVFKRAGIISIKKNKVTVEVIGNERIETLVKRNDKIMVSDDYLRELIREANKKMDKNKANISEYYKLIKNLN